MSRIDDLLQQAVVTGVIPAEATEPERAELERLLSAARATMELRSRVEAEAMASLPVAQARFERFVAGQQPQAVAIPRPASSRPKVAFPGRLFARHRRLLLSGAAVAIGLLAVIAVAGSQVLLSDTETASALVLSPDDYVQVQGVVRKISGSGENRAIVLDSAVDSVRVVLNSETSVVDEATTVDASIIKAGDQLLVGGVVGANREVTANTVAVSNARGVTPKVIKLKNLRELPPNLEGQVALLAVAKDGQHANVLVDAADGHRYLVKVNARTAEALVRLRSALGARVRVTSGDNPKGDVFALVLTEHRGESPAPGRTSTPGPSPSTTPGAGGVARPDAGDSAGTPAFVTVRGIVVARDLNVLQVLTLSGRVPVAIRPATLRLWSESGVPASETANPDVVIGHIVAVTGGIDARTGRVVADTIVVGPKRP